MMIFKHFNAKFDKISSDEPGDSGESQSFKKLCFRGFFKGPVVGIWQMIMSLKSDQIHKH